MPAALVVPFTLGCLAVLQAALNRRIAAVMGLTQAVILNAAILVIVAAVFWGCVRVSRGPSGPWLSGAGSFGDFQWWWIVPGLCGLGLVAGLPWAVERVGSLQAFVVLVAAQMLFGIVWDHAVEGVPASVPRVIGAVLAIVGAAVTTIRI